MIRPLLPPPRRALVRTPSRGAPAGVRSGTGPPPPADAIIAEHAGYVAALRDAGVEVTELPAIEDLPDAHFVEDAAVILGEDLAVLTVPGEAKRREEVSALAPHLPHAQVLTLAAMGSDDARLDGGDVLIAADRVLIGLSARTNMAGARALSRILAHHRPTWPVSVVRVQGVLHLKSGLTEIAPGVVIRSPLMRAPADAFALAGLEEIELGQAAALGANVLPLGKITLVPAGVPAVAREAARYAEVFEVDMTATTEMDGGLTCLSLRW